MTPPTWTIRKDDRNELFIRRHMDIPARSRCCKSHTVNDHLSREAFYLYRHTNWKIGLSLNKIL